MFHTGTLYLEEAAGLQKNPSCACQPVEAKRVPDGPRLLVRAIPVSLHDLMTIIHPAIVAAPVHVGKQLPLLLLLQG